MGWQVGGRQVSGGGEGKGQRKQQYVTGNTVQRKETLDSELCGIGKTCNQAVLSSVKMGQ